MKRIYALFVAVSVVCSLYADIPAGLRIEWDYDENTYIELETLSGNEAALTYYNTTAEHAIIPSVVWVEYEGSEYKLTVKVIGKPNEYCYVFKSCESLKSIEIPNSVEIIGICAFAECLFLTSVEIPESVTNIGASAFSNCVSLKSIKIGNGIKSIGGHAFERCESLTSVEIPGSVDGIGDYAFAQCRSLETLEIGNGVKSIGEHAFQICSSLASVEIPGSVDSIGDYAFWGGCRSLASVEIGSGVKSMGELAFAYCPNLENITVDKKNPFYDSREECNAVIKTLTNELVVGCKNSFIPNSVESIGSSAFSGCLYLASVEIPNSVEIIGDGAFYECNFLETVKIGNGVKSIEDDAFTECYSLESVYCAALTPPEIAVYEAFDYYFGEFYMETYELKQPMPTTLYVPEEAIGRYKDAEWWGKGECEEDSNYPYGQRCEYFQIIKPMPEGTGTEDVREEDGFAVYVRDGVIYVEETEEEVEVYDVTGRKVYDGEKGAIPVGRPGVYIVRSGENVEKVVAG